MQRQLHNLIVLTTYSIIPHYVKTDYGRKSTPLHQRGTHVNFMVMQRSCSSCCDVSVSRVSPARELAMMPALLTSESENIDLPWSTWAITDTLRMFNRLSMISRTLGRERGGGGEGYINRGFYVVVLANHNSTYVKGNCCTEVKHACAHVRCTCKLTWSIVKFTWIEGERERACQHH